MGAQSNALFSSDLSTEGGMVIKSRFFSDIFFTDHFSNIQIHEIHSRPVFYGRKFILETRLTQRNVNQSMDWTVEGRNLIWPTGKR